MLSIPFRALTPLALITIAAAGLPLAAQSPSDESLAQELLELLNTPVKGASKREQRLMDSPQAIEVVTGEELRIMGIHRLQDALKLLTSIDLLESDLGYSVVGMRGVMQEGQPRTVQVLIDGVPLYVPLGSALDVNNLPVALDLVDRIEVVRGPSSTLYGANAVVGVIAITTRKAGNGFHGGAQVAGIEKSSVRGRAHLGWSDGSFGFIAGYQGASFGNSDLRTHKVGSTGPTDWVVFDGKDLAGHQTDKAHQSQASARLDWSVGESRFWFTAGQASKKLSPPGIPPVSYSNYRFSQTNTLLLGWGHTWSPAFSTEVRLHRMRNQVGSGPTQLLAVVTQDPGWNAEYTWGDLTSDQIDLQANWNPTAKLHFVFGADTRRMNAEPARMWGFSERIRETASGGFASLDWDTSNDTALSLGFRVENETLGGSRVSPRAAFVWRPTPASVLRLAYLTSTRSPQIMEQRINFAAHYPASPFPVVYRILPNPDLKPEETENIELGYRHQFGPVTLDATIYHMKLADLIGQVTVAVGPPVDTRFENTGDATNTGAELALTWQASKGWTVGFNAAYVDFQREEALPPLGKDFAYTAPFKANVWTRFTSGRFAGFLSLQHTGSTDVEALQVYGAPLFDQRDAFLQVNARLGYEMLNGLTVGVYAQNAAREHTPQGATGPDRPIYDYAARREVGLTLEYRF